MEGTNHPERSDAPSDTVPLSTGQTVSLPLRCRARLGGVVVGARWNRLRAVLPAEVTPIRTGLRSGAVVLVGVDYRSVGEFEPYDEFAVVVPVARTVAGSGVALPELGTPGYGFGGYVYDLPVTTAASRTLGEEVWGFPKSVTAVDVSGDPTRLEVTVGEGGETTPELSLSTVVDARRTPRRVRSRLHAFSFLDDRLVRVPVDLDCVCRLGFGAGAGAGIGAGAGGDERRGVRLAVGRGRYAEAVRDLGLTGRVYARFVASHAEFDVGVPVDVRREDRTGT